MKVLVSYDNRQWVEERPDPVIPDDQIWARFRQTPDAGIGNDEFRMTLDTRYLQPFLYFWARTIHARTIVEIGAGCAGSTLPLLKAAAEMGGTLFCVDPSNGAQALARGVAARYGAEHAFCSCEMSSDGFFSSVGDGLAIDFAFIDGDHNCAAVESDARNVLDRLVPGGVVVFHEYDIPTIPPWEQIAKYERTTPPELSGLDFGTPRALRYVVADYDVDVMPLHFGACGVNRVSEWTEAGAIALRKRLPNEFRVRA